MRISSVMAAFIVVGLFVAPFLFGLSAYATTQQQGYVQYGVALSNGTETQAFSVRESAQPSSTVGFSILNLTLSSSISNFSYARLVNSSRIVFPYLVPAVMENQSLSYQYQSLSASFSINRNGSSNTVFNGSNYELSDYVFKGSFSYSNYPVKGSVNGQITSFPSNLVYSLEAKLNQTDSIQIELESTNLSLNAPDPSPLSSPIAEAATIAGGAALLACAGLFFLLRRGKKLESAPSQKPSYWVD